MRKLMSILLLSAIVLGINVNSAKASTVFYAEKSGASHFRTEWASTKGNDTRKIIYGYDTRTILSNQDYVKGYHSSLSHSVYLKRGTSMTGLANAKGGEWAEKRADHQNNNVQYVMLY